MGPSSRSVRCNASGVEVTKLPFAPVLLGRVIEGIDVGGALALRRRFARLLDHIVGVERLEDVVGGFSVVPGLIGHAVAVPTALRRQPPEGNNAFGLRMLSGSRARLIARIASISSGLRLRCSQRFFAVPIPCSALMLPPSEAT